MSDNIKSIDELKNRNRIQTNEETKLFASVKIYDDCSVGARVTIHSGTVIGGDGFGFAPQKDGSFKKVPQVGNVIIEDDVEIEIGRAHV